MQTTMTPPQAQDRLMGTGGPTRITMEAYLDALVGGGDYGVHLADDVALTAMETGEVTRGRAAVVGLIDYLHQQAFTATVVVTSLVVEGGRATLEAEFAGTHVGEFAGVASTGREVRVPYAVAYDLTDGAITALRLYLPMDAIVRQIRGT